MLLKHLVAVLISARTIGTNHFLLCTEKSNPTYIKNCFYSITSIVYVLVFGWENIAAIAVD